jgi:hypothetical protein
MKNWEMFLILIGAYARAIIVVTLAFAVLVFVFGYSTKACAQPIKPTSDVRKFELTIEWYDDRLSVINRCRKLGAWRGVPDDLVVRQRYPGCAEFYPESNRCVIHVQRPKMLDDPLTTVVGHEVLHCALGEYH